MLDLYGVIMRAADHIEAHPREFDFASTSIPSIPGCGIAGCALGWIGYFAGVRGGIVKVAGYEPSSTVVSTVLGITAITFYSRMNAIGMGMVHWSIFAKDCARCLRLYAEQYHRMPMKDAA